MGEEDVNKSQETEVAHTDHEKEKPEVINELRKGRGAPSKIKTGIRGRPKK